jgi:hypothetical protein
MIDRRVAAESAWAAAAADLRLCAVRRTGAESPRPGPAGAAGQWDGAPVRAA